MIATLAIIAAALFVGAAIFVLVVEHPARLALDDRHALIQWKPSYHRGAIMQGALAIVAGALGLVAWWRSGEALWLAGAIAILANWPFTLIVIMPTNRRLQALAPDEPTPDTRALLIAWGNFHAVRTALGALALTLFVIA